MATVKVDGGNSGGESAAAAGDRSRCGPSNVPLQLTGASTSEALRLSALRVF
jgi:hypothetical protein